MKILYHLPAPDTIYAGRTIYFGYKHAFEKNNHSFTTYTPSDNLERLLEDYDPDIFFTSIGPLHLKYLNFNTLRRFKKRKLKIFVNTPFWKSPMSSLRINETQSISTNKEWVKLIKSGDFGDIYFNICEEGDDRMYGFQKETGYKHHTVLLAADDSIPMPDFDERFASDISFIGSFLPGKRQFFEDYIFPLAKEYNLKLYGRDWTRLDRTLNFIHKVGQYFNIPYMRSFKKYKPTLEEERIIHRSSTIALNVHEDYQKEFSGDINERTFKIPHSGGFEIVDNVPSLAKYFVEDKELVIAKDGEDWLEKVRYYLKYPEKRLPIIKAGRRKVLKFHTYTQRVKQFEDLYNTL